MNHTFPCLVSPFDVVAAPCAPDLVDGLIAHDPLAFQQLVHLHGPRMLAVATRYLHSPSDAEDALQDAFVNVVRAIDGFQRASSLETWLHRIVVNCSLMNLRRRRRKPEVALDEQAIERGLNRPHQASAAPSAQHLLEAAELSERMRAAVARLPESQRTVLMLRDVHGTGLRAIAEMLDVGVSTVKLRLRGARQALHASMRVKPSASASSTRRLVGAPRPVWRV